MLNGSSNGSVVVELIVSVALIVGVGLVAHVAQSGGSNGNPAVQIVASE